MTSCFAKMVTQHLLKYKLIRNFDKEYYVYSFQCLIEHCMSFAFLLVISRYFELFFETIIFMFTFSNIRRYSGGFHAKSYLGCLLSSLFIYIGYVKVIYPIFLANPKYNWAALVAGYLIILLIGAMNHKDMDLSIKEFSANKSVARLVVTIEMSCIIALYAIGVSSNFILFMSFGVILTAVLLVLGKVKRQEVSYNEGNIRKKIVGNG